MSRTFSLGAGLLFSLFAIVLASPSSTVNAAIITPVGVQASSQLTGGREASSTIDGATSGLDPAITNATVAEANIGTWKHDSTDNNAWLSNNTDQVRITFDLGSVQTVAGIWVWNNISNYPSTATGVTYDSGYRGVKAVTAWKTDGASNTLVAGGLDVQIPGITQFNRSPDPPMTTGLPAGVARTDYFWAPTYYPFTSAVTAQFIKLDITSSWNPPGTPNGGQLGDSFKYTGFAEIRFQTETTPAPEPTSIILLVFGLVAMVGVCRRKKHRQF